MNVHEIAELPTNDQVLAHGFDFRPGWWQPRVDKTWASFLSDLPAAEGGDGYHHITRRDLLTFDTDRTPGANGRLLLACYVWGTGKWGFLVGRRALVFRDTKSDVLDKRLTAAQQVLDKHGPAAAYEALHDGGPYRTTHMRASFFTKFLYAADAPGDGAPGRALILDRFVAIALNDLHQWGMPEQGGWSPETYQRWLDLAHDRARDASEGTCSLVRPDAVEMAYFKYGQTLWRDRRAMRRR